MTAKAKYDPTVPPPQAGSYELGEVQRFDVRFPSDGYSLAGHLYVSPDGQAAGPGAGIVIDGPGGSVKELTVPVYAIRLARAGYRVLTYDRRGFGESEGRLRQHVDANEHIADFRNAVTYLTSRDDVDSERVAGIGICAGGGFVLQSGAMDRRLKCIATIAGAYSTMRPIRDAVGHEAWVEQQRQYANERLQDLKAGRVRSQQALAPTSAASGTAAMHIDEAWNFYTRRQREVGPNWKNEITCVSMDNLMTFDAIRFADLISPTPLLIIHGTVDEPTPPRYAQEAYDAAKEPKQLIWIETTNHIQLYDQEPQVSQAFDALLPFLAQHCRTERGEKITVRAPTRPPQAASAQSALS